MRQDHDEGGGVFCFARLWVRWRVLAGLVLIRSLSEFRDGDVLGISTILTTFANADMERAHNRMPAILPTDAFGSWLAGDEVVLAPWPAGTMTLHAVSSLVNKATPDDSRCIEPVAVL